MVSTTEVAKDVFRISVFVPEINLEFSHFLVRDDEPLLFHAGLRRMFPVLREALRDLATVMRDVLGPKAGETTSIGTIKTEDSGRS